MNKVEAAKLLELITLSYPNAYRGMEDAWKKATINMWQMSFPDVPYAIMEQAFNHFRMVSKFPPTVAEMVEELRHIYNQATEDALIFKTLGDTDRVHRCLWVRAQTARYNDPSNLGSLDVDRFPKLNGGTENVQRLGASGDHLRTEDRLSLQDAGE